MAPRFTEHLYIYRFGPSVKGVLESVANGLFDWQNPNLPDDLHLLRANGSTWLGCTAHENSAWLELTESEHSFIEARAPELAAVLRPDPARES